MDFSRRLKNVNWISVFTILQFKMKQNR